MADSPEDEIRQERATAVKTKGAIQQLKASEGWSMLRRVMDSQVQQLVNNLVVQASTPETIYQSEYDKGKIAAYRILASLPDLLLDQAEITLQSTPDDEKGEVNA